MAKKYNPLKIEKKWQNYWEKNQIFKAKDFSKKKKFYCLDMFPYPSGEGLHVGHPHGYVATDIISHYKRLSGYNVLHPMGWDAFGLPAENYAIKNGVHPSISTKKNIKRFKEQIKSIGLSYDWSREINTTDPSYYKWTQWIFLLLFKRGLAYEAILPINFCPSCKTGLANEEVIDDKCERCGTKVVKKNLRQWVLKITAYADRLLKDLDGLDWPEKIITMQKNWIGKSEGWQIKFKVLNSNLDIEVFTTRLDTIFGCTYLVLSPEHPLINNLKDKILNYNLVKKYIEEAINKTERERISEVKEKRGIKLEGIKAINPANNKEIDIFIADYVLSYYGTGAVMAVPYHDQRDFDFAKKFDLEFIKVIKPEKESDIKEAYEGEGVLINSGIFNGMKSFVAREKIGEWLLKKNLAKKTVNYKLRDWIFSRQRYWGEPIPIVHCNKCGIVPLSEKDLPLKLPKIKKYQPSGTGESPLATIEKWVNTKCPKCKGPAKRETNTMPQWAGSCWYFLRYVDPKNNKKIFDYRKGKYFLPVDLYVGGVEHAVLHLLYSRFWIKVLYDEGIVDFKEPFLKLRNQGLILASDGRKMSKSLGNVVNPDEVIKKYGADSFRVYHMFMGPFDQPVTWQTKGIKGVRRFLERVYNASDKVKKVKTKNKELEKLLHLTIKKVEEDIENFRFNTAISSLMVLLNKMEKEKEIDIKHFSAFLILLSPFAPHLSEELWQKLGNKKSIFFYKWPKYNSLYIKEEKTTFIIQVNGKVRDKIEVEYNISEEEAKKIALSQDKIKKWIDNKDIKKIIFVPNKLINFVV
ncbi:MAG TPA: leucine--tRNA ligase [Candidatus Pacearchaeota archaeon]|nr:leucine--tRNA ligase [Candidatus Pacearchaeota archaeon]